MDRVGDDLLAGTALALDQHVALVVLQALDHSAQRARLRRAPHQLWAPATSPELLLELLVAGHEPAPIDGLANRGANPVGIVEGLLEVVERPTAHASHGAFDAGVAGHDDDLDLGPGCLHLIENVEAVRRAEEEIEQDHIESRIVEGRAHLIGARSREHPVTLGPENPLECPKQKRLVVHEEHHSARVMGTHLPLRRRFPGLRAHGDPIGPGSTTLEKGPRVGLNTLEPTSTLLLLPPDAEVPPCRNPTSSSWTTRSSTDEHWNGSSAVWGTMSRPPGTRPRRCPW